MILKYCKKLLYNDTVGRHQKVNEFCLDIVYFEAECKF